MDKPTILTRAYTDPSDAQLISRKGPRGSLSRTELLNEFRNHAIIHNREPTALISVSTRIVDTVKRCFDKRYIDGEPSGTIWIAFIEVPAVPLHETRHVRVHPASGLAEACGLSDPNLFEFEMVFEWAVPEEYVVHKVSLQTLMDRGLQWETKYGFHHQLPATAELRDQIATDLQPCDPWGIGIYLGCFARKFGARAPLNWIATQLFYDCVKTRRLCEDVVKLTFVKGQSEIVDCDFFCALDDGMDTALIDWWLADLDFFQECSEFWEWRDEMIENDLLDAAERFWDLEDDDCDDIAREIAMDVIWTKQEETEALIEREAVKIGL